MQAEPQAEDLLIGVAEVAKLAGVTPAAVANWRARGTRGFPAPAQEGRGGPLYRATEISGWLRRSPAHGRQPPQPLLGIEGSLWGAADKLRGSIDASQYRHVVLTLLFLRRLLTPGAAPVGVVVPADLSWETVRGSRDEALNETIKAAVQAVEHDNPSLRGAVPQVFASSIIDARRLRGLVDIVSAIAADDVGLRDQIGRTYEYFLGRFAAVEGRSGGEFYTPSTVVRLLAEVVEPLTGTLYDPCCGSGGMFVQSVRVKDAHGSGDQPLRIVGQEMNAATWRLARMNLALNDLDADLGSEPADTFHEDQHPGLKADYVLANPPFNISDWGVETLTQDPRWRFGVPPGSNANLAWVQHIWSVLSPRGRAGIVLSNGTSASDAPAEMAIRAGLLEADAIECMVALPSQLFYSTTIPVTLWFLAKDKTAGRRAGQVLFIDARDLGEKVTRSHRELRDVDIQRIVTAYQSWTHGSFVPDPGFAAVASTDEIKAARWSLVPSRYVGGSAAELPQESLEQLVAEFRILHAEAADLDRDILSMLAHA
jgi:type I restriction enzyme M protein